MQRVGILYPDEGGQNVRHKETRGALRQFLKQTKGSDISAEELRPMSNRNAEILWRYAGLSGESGKFAERFKKIIRDKHGRISKKDRKFLLSTLADIKVHRERLMEALTDVRTRTPRKLSTINTGILWRIAGLGGEFGEFAERFEKILSDKNGAISAEDRELLLYELGDILWYVARLVYCLNSSFEDVLAMNAKKLKSRVRRGVIHGSGDKR